MTTVIGLTRGLCHEGRLVAAARCLSLDLALRLPMFDMQPELHVWGMECERHGHLPGSDSLMKDNVELQCGKCVFAA